MTTGEAVNYAPISAPGRADVGQLEVLHSSLPPAGNVESPGRERASVIISTQRSASPKRNHLNSDMGELGRDVELTVSEQEDDVAVVKVSRRSYIQQGSCVQFVEAGWFQVLSACVIISNTAFMFLEQSDDSWTAVFFWPDQATLCFYIFEMCCRIALYSKLYCCGPRTKVFWNMLDVVVVFAGCFDQWLLPFLPVVNDGLNSVILLFRMLRLLRVVKIIRVFLETDLTWTEQPMFQSFIGGVIAFNGLLMGFETDVESPVWFYIEQVLLVIYVFELMVRVKRHGFSFLSCENPDIVWNILDSVIVVSSAIDSWIMPLIQIIAISLAGPTDTREESKGMKLSQVMMLMRMLRLMRILRLVKLVKSVRPLFILVTGVVAAFQSIFWVLVLTVVTLYAAGILSTRLLGHGLLFEADKIPESVWVFKTVPDSMFTLFRVMSGASSETESKAIDDLMASLPVVKFAFIFFMVTSSWTLLSILTAVVSDCMITTTGTEEAEQVLTSDEADRAEHIAELTALFGTMSKSQDGMVHLEDITSFLKNKDNALVSAKKCRVASRNVLDVLKNLALGAFPNGVKMEVFVERMADVGVPSTEQSMMKIESLIKKARRNFDEHQEAIASRIDAAHESHLGAGAHSESEPMFSEQSMEALQGLAEQQTICDQGIDKLHESIQSLLRSQEDLVRDQVGTRENVSKMESRMSSLAQKTTDGVTNLAGSLQAVQTIIQRAATASQ